MKNNKNILHLFIKESIVLFGYAFIIFKPNSIAFNKGAFVIFKENSIAFHKDLQRMVDMKFC